MRIAFKGWLDSFRSQATLIGVLALDFAGLQVDRHAGDYQADAKCDYNDHGNLRPVKDAIDDLVHDFGVTHMFIRTVRLNRAGGS
jgi:hypothetical protein